MAGNLAENIKLAIWRSTFTTAELKSTIISNTYSKTVPNIFHLGPIKLPNLIPVNISGYTVYTLNSCKADIAHTTQLESLLRVFHW